MILRQYATQVISSIVAEYANYDLQFLSISSTVIVYSYIDEQHLFIHVTELHPTMDIIESDNELYCISQD